MRKIGDISLFKFQQIDDINSREIEDIDKLLFSVCVIFDLTEWELDNMNPRKAHRLIRRVEKIFSKGFKVEAPEKIGKHKITYDPSALTFGQYIELMFFLGMNKEPVKAAHYVLASISSADADTHRERSEYFLTQPIKKTLGVVQKFIENLNKFNDEYKSLFGVDPEVNGKVQGEQFNRRYGWIYSASQVAEYERITLDAAYKLPIRRALNDLAYLKAKNKYEQEIIKK